MKEIDIKSIRTTAQASPNLIASILIALGYQTLESGLGNRGFGNGIVLPIVMATLTLSGVLPTLVAVGLTLSAAATVIALTGGSFALFAIFTLISAQYQMRKTRTGIIEARQKLNKLLVDVENELRALIINLHLLEQGVKEDKLPKDKLGDMEGGDDLKRNILEKIVTLLDQIPSSKNTSRVQKLEILFGTDSESKLQDKIINLKENEVASEEQQKLKAGLSSCLTFLKSDIQIQESDKASHQKLLCTKLGDFKVNDEDKYIRRFGYATTIIGGFSLGFGTAISIAVITGLATAAFMVTFPWILIPIAIGAIAAATAITLNVKIKKKMERQKKQLDTANNEILGVKKYLHCINQNTKRNVKALSEAYSHEKDKLGQTNQNQKQQTELEQLQKDIELERIELKTQQETLIHHQTEISKKEELISLEKNELRQQKNALLQQEQNVAVRENQNAQRSQQLEEKAKELNAQNEQNLKAQAELVIQKQHQDINRKNLEQLRLELEQQQKELQAKLNELGASNQQESQNQDLVSAQAVANQMLQVFANKDDHTKIFNGKTTIQTDITRKKRKCRKFIMKNNGGRIARKVRKHFSSKRTSKSPPHFFS